MKEFNDLLKSIGGNRRELAEAIGIEYISLTSQLAKSKTVPKWAKSMVYMDRKLKETKQNNL